MTTDADDPAPPATRPNPWYLPPWMDLLLVAVVALLVSAMPTLFRARPEPTVHDEFSNLLAGDTFAHFRLTNSPHPLWQHFETFHVLQQPTYASKFPPGMGLALAVGQWLGEPIMGVWLAISLACAATTWALRAWLPRSWALGVGLATSILPVVYWWSQGYWGGSLPMLGGALLTGAAVRARTDPTARLGVAAAFGAIVLGLSRPFEGAMTCVIVAALLLPSLIRPTTTGYRRRVARFVAAGAVTLVPFAVWLGYYNWRVTGSPAILPYTVHAQQYMAAPLFFGQPFPPAPPYRHDVMRRFHTEIEVSEYLRDGGGQGRLLDSMKSKWATLARAYLNPWPLLLLLAAGLTALRQPDVRFALAVALLLPLMHMFCTPWFRLHYMAPALACWLALIGAGARQLDRWRVAGMRWGRLLLVVIGGLYLVLSVQWAGSYSRALAGDAGRERAKFVQWLRSQPGDDLVIVEYGREHAPTSEWVFNAADLGSAPVIFARSLGDEADRRLIEAFPSRHVWRLRLNNAVESLQKVR